MAKKELYRVTTQVVSAAGSQSWLIEAISEEEAIAAVKDGGGDFEFEEIEVTELGESTCEKVKD
jgi:hypothetical protein